MRRILLIDGDYFANRCLGSLNSQTSKNNLLTKNEQDEFETAMVIQLNKLWSRCSLYFDSFIYVADSLSWRKKLPPYKPYYITDDTIIGYKEQRIELKEKSEIDYVMFRKLYNNFKEKLKHQVLTIDDLEGDDVLYLLSKKFKDIEFCIYGTDKDLIQLVSNNCFMLRNIKSKQCPDGMFCLSPGLYHKYFLHDGVDSKSLLLQSSKDYDHSSFTDLMNINIYDDNVCNRKLNEGIEIAGIFQLLLVKIICGDKSDNIFPIIRWKSKNGSMNYSVTEKYIEKTLNIMNMTLSESDCLQILKSETTDITLFDDFIHNLIIQCKQNLEYDQINSIKQHYNHNKKLIYINNKYFPENSMNLFNNLISNTNLVNILYKDNTTPENLMNIIGNNIQFDDNATRLLLSSIQ